MATTSSSSLAIFLFLGALIGISSSAAASASQAFELGWVAPSSEKIGKCRGSIAECGGAAVEFEMDSEINRRVLATTQYISYGALQGNTVPCSQRGASYYNCQKGAEANPYSRGCSEIARCRS